MAVRDLLGILEDGTGKSAELPITPRVTLQMTRGSTLRVRLQVLGENGAPVNLANGPATLALVVKRKASQGSADLIVTGALNPSEGVNRAEFAITPDNTKFLDPGRYTYDVWMTHPGGRDPIVPYSPFLIEPGLQLS